MRPSPAVLAAFGAAPGAGTDRGAAPVPLPGGQGSAWRAGQLVLKPAGDLRVARWAAGLYLSLSGRQDPGFRVPRPLRCPAGNGAAGDWGAQDSETGAWVAWQWLPGEPADWTGRSAAWPGLIAASRAFHAALAGWPAPPGRKVRNR